MVGSKSMEKKHGIKKEKRREKRKGNEEWKKRREGGKERKMERGGESGMKDVARVWERRIGKRKGV